MKTVYICLFFILFSCIPNKKHYEAYEDEYRETACNVELHNADLQKGKSYHGRMYSKVWLTHILKNEVPEYMQGSYFIDSIYCLKNNNKTKLKKFLKKNLKSVQNPYYIRVYENEKNGDGFPYESALIFKNEQDTIYMTSNFKLWKIDKKLYELDSLGTIDFIAYFKWYYTCKL
ncbi:hypothetical protein ETU10_10550 [Apibacter muscae]|uniref:hypothetical protein n=1 Tax=Apibacter muscae TaxID=2509004 RepID=UPI0011AC89E9|nr:hypothetical protein [Apibacter muscae]TWP22506.1 hypothetical protein ETU10_10550 [Apibacter muscae]